MQELFKELCDRSMGEVGTPNKFIISVIGLTDFLSLFCSDVFTFHMASPCDVSQQISHVTCEINLKPRFGSLPGKQTVTRNLYQM